MPAQHPWTRASPAGVTRGQRSWEPHVHRPDIQGLRAIAVLVVVLFHAGVPGLKGGFVGVDVFFVISGYLITGLLLRAHESGGRGVLLQFYARRALRILPLATTVLVTTAVAGWIWLPATRIGDLTRNVTAAGGFALNLLQIHDGQEYLRLGSAVSPVQHFWSLGVEEQFYLVWPLLIAAAVMLHRRLRVPLWTLMLLAGGTSFGWCLIATGQGAARAYFDPTARGWELAAGALLATQVVRLERSPAAAAIALRWAGWAGLAGIGWAVCTFNEATAFPGWRAAIPVLGTVAVLAAGTAGRNGLLEAEPLTLIGEYSYGWYLWHWPVLVIAPFALGRHFGLKENLAAVGAALVLARITFAVVEHPGRTSRLRARPVLAVLLGLALAATSIGTAEVVSAQPPREASGAESAAPEADLTHESAPDRKLAVALERAALVGTVPNNLNPRLTKARFDAPQVYRDGCHLEAEPTSWPRRCENYGRAGAQRTVVLFGDSHAAQWFPALERIAQQRGWRLVSLTKGACSAADVRIYFDLYKRGYDECVTWRQRVLKRIGQLRPDMVVTSSNYDGGTVLNPDSSEIAPNKQDQAWDAGWTRTLQRLTAETGRLVYLEDTPWQADNVPDCLAEHLDDVRACVTSRSAATAGPRRGLIRQAARAAGATVVDPARWFCTADLCPVIFGNILMYQDASHVTPQYARVLAPVVRSRLGM